MLIFRLFCRIWDLMLVLHIAYWVYLRLEARVDVHWLSIHSEDFVLPHHPCCSSFTLTWLPTAQLTVMVQVSVVVLWSCLPVTHVSPHPSPRIYTELPPTWLSGYLPTISTSITSLPLCIRWAQPFEQKSGIKSRKR